MVIGFVAGRRQVLQDVAAHEGWLRRFSLGSLFLGLGCGAFFATGIQGLDRTVVTPFRVLVGLSFIVNRLLLSAFYISAFTLLCQRASWRHRWSSLAAVGRMSLTNYLLQSLLCTTLFYSYGLALFGRIGPLVSSLLAFALYGAQVVASNVWARDHTQGPVEWLWRVLTYGRQVLRRGE